MRKPSLLVFAGMIVNVLIWGSVRAGGISVDAGLTPAEDRWIFRTQLRFMQRRDDPTLMDRKMDTYALPVVLAYGVHSDFTLLVRQAVMHRKTSMAGSTSRDSGFGDFYVLGKYEFYRRNTPDYTLGVAPTLGLELPTGDDDFGSETWDLEPGLFASWRSGPWASDFDMAYKWNGFADKGRGGLDPGNELSLDLALARQFSVGEKAETAFAPVIEFSYRHILPDGLRGHDVANTGESIFFISPGFKFTKSSFIVEALVQLPVWQDQEGTQLEQGMRFILGARYMF